MTNRTEVMLSGVKKRYIVYYNGLSRGEPVEEGTPHEVPIGTFCQQTATTLMDVTVNGKNLPGLKGIPLEAGPRTFIRGRLVEGDEAQQLLVPPEIRDLQAMLKEAIVVDLMTIVGEEENVRVVAIKQRNGTEAVLLLQDDDVPPPADASPYAVGESPEEVAAQEAAKPERRFCPDCLTDDHEVDPTTALTAEEAAQERVVRGAGSMESWDDEEEVSRDWDPSPKDASSNDPRRN